MVQEYTNEQRVQELNRLIDSVQKEIDRCTQEIESPVLLACNCIVATADAEYQIGISDESKATVLVGHYTTPCFFSEKLANKVAKEVKASNGYGPLQFTVWGWKSFFKARRNALQERIDCFVELRNKFMN